MDCTLQLFRRPAKFKGDPGEHTYLDLCNGSDCQIVEGGRDNDKSDPKVGTLQGFINPPGGNVLGAGTRHASDPTHDSQIGGTQSIPCDDISLIDGIVGKYNAGSRVPYAFLPNGKTTYNSNSFTSTLLSDIGLQGTFNLPQYALGHFYPGVGIYRAGFAMTIGADLRSWASS